MQPAVVSGFRPPPHAPTPPLPTDLGASCGPRCSPAGALSAHPAQHLPGAQTHQEPRRRGRPSASAPPLRPTEGPLAPTPPAKHTTFLREQTSHRQAHGQTPRHSHAPTRRETAGRRKLLSQSHSTCERPGPEERTGGRLSGETEAERDEGSETDWKTARGRYRQTRHTHTHTHTHPGKYLEILPHPWKYFRS